MKIAQLRVHSVLLVWIAGALIFDSAGHAQQRDGAADNGVRRVVNSGFVFCDGQYLERPYVLRQEGDQYYVNDLNLSTSGVDLSMYERERTSRQAERNWRRRPRGGRGDAGRDPGSQLASNIESSLFLSDMVLLVPGLPLVIYEGSDEGADLLRVLIDEQKCAAAAASVPDWKPTLPLKPIDQQRLTEHLSQWLASFQPSSAFLADAAAQLEALDSAKAANAASSAATIRLATFSYPLTIVAMVLVVLGFGHLLSHRPDTDGPTDGSLSSEADRLYVRSLMLIGGLSLLDLAWTILASQAGTMHEMNPIGHELIDNPLHLIAFKLLVTSTAIGLLYVCRRVPLAQQASWWSCLVLTLVTARWLIFNSMFLS